MRKLNTFKFRMIISLNLLLFLNSITIIGYSQSYQEVCTKQGNEEAWSGGVFNQGSYPSNWTGTGSISYYSWGSLGYDSDDGQAY